MLLDRHQAWEFSLLSLCLWREARGETYRGKVAVAWAIKNRVQKPSWWGRTYPSVILKPWQFSSFNGNDPNAVKFPAETDESWQTCLAIAEDVYADIAADPTGGATHYHALTVSPDWAKTAQFKVEIGNHRFYIAN